MHFDADLDSAVWNAAGIGEPGAAILGVAGALADVRQAVSIVFDVQDAEPSTVDEPVAGALAKRLGARACIAPRDVPASQWVSRRALSLGVDGFAVRRPDAFVPADVKTDRWALVEFGTPTQLLKVQLRGVPPDALARLCDAVGNERGGLLHVGAYPGVSASSGEPFLLLECSDPSKSPLHRALTLLDIEAARYGGAVGRAVALSFFPLDGLLQILAARMPLDASGKQVIETHIGRAPA